MIGQGLASTADQWPTIRTAFGWLHQAAHVLNNPSERTAPAVRRAYRFLLAKMRRDADRAGSLESAVHHFVKVTDSYWPGLFVCYRRPDVPRTNNDLEHLFGSVRYHERRASGRKVTAPMFLTRGRVRLITAAYDQHAFSSTELRPSNLTAWRALRQELSQHRRRALSSVISDTIRPPIWPKPNASSTRKLCRPRKKHGWSTPSHARGDCPTRIPALRIPRTQGWQRRRGLAARRTGARASLCVVSTTPKARCQTWSGRCRFNVSMRLVPT